VLSRAARSATRRWSRPNETHLWQVRQLLRRRACFEVIEVRYADVLKDAAAEAMRVEEFLRLGLDVGRMPGVVEVELYRHRRG
jgi:hypothetical protein